MDLLKVALLAVIILLTGSLTATDHIPASSSAPDQELEARITEIFNTRAHALITGADQSPVPADYDTGSKLGRWALSHEQNKLNFVQLWAQKRGVRFVEAEPAVRIPWRRVRGDTADFLVYQTLRLGYVYPGDPRVNRFGIGTRHSMKLVRKEGKWLIRQDFYTDGLGDDTLVPNPTPADGPARIEAQAKPAAAKQDAPVLYDREGAARYADEYAGLAWGAGNNHKYNPRYRDLTGIGGDCTNFVSQCLGDAEGGRLPMDGVWYYRYDHRGGSGSRAWVQTEAFANWLLYGGRARRLARDTFPELNQPGAGFPQGAVRALEKGDLIGYEEKGHIEHFAIVVGTDSQGYPVVNAHTVDRYHCPWDMGWDKRTVFHLFQIHDRVN